MAKIAEFTKAQILVDVENFKNNKFSKTKMSVEWMDSYVAKVEPDTIDSWIEKCIAIQMTNRTINDKEIAFKDVKAIREAFIATYFPDFTEEAKKLAKEEERKRKKAEKEALKEAEKNLSPEEKMRRKLEQLKNQE